MKTLDAGTFTVYPYGSTIPPVHAALFGVSSEAAGESSAGVLVSSQDPDPPEGALFYDNFASGNLNHTENGVQWTGSRQTSVVEDAGSPSGYAMRMRYNASEPGSWAEQRFSLGGQYSEIWIAWRMVVPEVYSHVDAPSTDNNKWLRLWSEDYTNYGVKFGASLWPMGANDGSSLLRTDLGNSERGVRSVGAAANNFLGPADRGEEMFFVHQAKIDTSGNDAREVTGGNGIFRVWRNGVLVIDYDTIANTPTAGYVNAFESGYILGAANADYGYPDYTVHDFLFREVIIATSNIFGVSV